MFFCLETRQLLARETVTPHACTRNAEIVGALSFYQEFILLKNTVFCLNVNNNLYCVKI